MSNGRHCSSWTLRALQAPARNIRGSRVVSEPEPDAALLRVWRPVVPADKLRPLPVPEGERPHNTLLASVEVRPWR